MAEYICEGPCGESKDIITGFYAANNKRGRDGTCIACRLLQANQRLSRRRLERDSANGYIKKGYPEAKYKPSPEKIAHESWLIRAENLFARIFFCPAGIKNSVRCPMRHKVAMECFDE